jgi:hypothetical protein
MISDCALIELRIENPLPKLTMIYVIYVIYMISDCADTLNRRSPKLSIINYQFKKIYLNLPPFKIN